MLGDALTYPKARDGWMKTIGIGGILLVLSILIIPAIFLSGYAVRVLRSAANDEMGPPVFDQWVEMFVDGLKLIVVQLVYAVFALIVVISINIPLILILQLDPQDLGTATTLPTGEGLAVSALNVLIYLGIFYVAYTGMARFAHEDRLAGAFEIVTVVRIAFTSEFFVGWILSLFVGLVLGLISAALSIIIIGIFLLFYVSIASYYLIGRGYGKAQSKVTGSTGRTVER